MPEQTVTETHFYPVKDWNDLEIENLNNIDLETFKNYLATL